MSTQTLPPVVGWLKYVIKWPTCFGEKPVYGVKVCPIEGSGGRRMILAKVLHDGELIQIQVAAEDITLNGRA